MAKERALHESFARTERAKVGSERAFGFVFAAVFARSRTDPREPTRSLR